MGKGEKGYGGKLALGAMIGAALGYVAGLLTAPQSGKETREDIKRKANEFYVAAEKELKKLHTELNEKLTIANEKLGELRAEGGKKFDDALEQAKKAKDKAREMLSSLHDGEADDKDLQKAITDATKAVENLRSYLKK